MTLNALFDTIVKRFHAYRAENERRANIRALLKFDDRTLYDIGYSRGSLHWALEQTEAPDLLKKTRDRSRREYSVAGRPQLQAGAPANAC